MEIPKSLVACRSSVARAVRVFLLSALSLGSVSAQQQRDETPLFASNAAGLSSQFNGLDLRMLRESVVRAIPPDTLRGLKERGLTRKKKKNKRRRRRKKNKKKKKGLSSTESRSTSSSSSSSSDTCKPEDVVLSDYQQWRDETGYWVGDYDFYNSDGDHFSSKSWPFQYKKYRGFITGNVDGNKYRQRNVFVYPPLPSSECADADQDVLNLFDGTCGENGNTKIFFADQEATTCSTNVAEEGNIEGPYLDSFYTETSLIGRENAVLYQVYLKAGAFGDFPAEDCLFQSQLTSITRSLDSQVYRTRSAQEFQCFDPATYGRPTVVSYYRERKVEESELYDELMKTLNEFGVTFGDTCAWMTNDFGGTVPSPYVDEPGPGMDACRTHLEQSFEDL